MIENKSITDSKTNQLQIAKQINYRQNKSITDSKTNQLQIAKQTYTDELVDVICNTL